MNSGFEDSMSIFWVTGFNGGASSPYSWGVDGKDSEYRMIENLVECFYEDGAENAILPGIKEHRFTCLPIEKALILFDGKALVVVGIDRINRHPGHYEQHNKCYQQPIFQEDQVWG